MDHADDEDDKDGLYDYLLDSGVLNDVHTVAESIVSSSMSSADLMTIGTDSDSDLESAARTIADRLMERNSDDLERALDAIVRDAKLAAAEGSTHRLDFQWPVLSDGSARRTPHETLRDLNALVRLPFTYDTYAGPYFRKLTKGLERTATVDAFFDRTARVYAKLVDTAPDAETAAESFGSLCEATHLRCQRHRHDFAKSVTAVCLVARCLPVVVRRSIGSCKHAKVAITEFLATMTVGSNRDPNGPYVILCCADPEARWFDHVAKYGSFRSAFFECLDGDRKLLRTVMSSFMDWMTEPEIPNKETANQSSLVKYGCFLHAASLLTKMYRYRIARTMFPVKMSRTTRIYAVALSNYCLGFLSANRNKMPATLVQSLCQLVAIVSRFHPEVVDSIGRNFSKFGVRILVQAIEYPEVLEAVTQRRQVVDELFKKRHRKDGEVIDCLIQIAAALSRHHQEIWQLVTRRMSFLEAAVARGLLHISGDGSFNGYWSLMVNVRCSPIGVLTYDLRDDDMRCSEDIDWLDPQRILCFSVSCSTNRGQERLIRLNEFGSLDRYVKNLLNRVETSLDPDDRNSLIDSIVRVAYSYCASNKGLRILLDDGDSFDVTKRIQLTELYYLSYEDFDSHSISRDVLVMLWLRLIEAVTHTFSSRVYADLKLKYQDTLSKLSAENRTENGIVFVDETTEFLTKLQRPLPPSSLSNSSQAKSDSETGKSDLMEFLTTANNLSTTAWSQRVLTMVIRSDHISAAELTDVIISFGRRRFDGELEADSVMRFDDRKSNLTDFDVAGLRLATRHGSRVGLASEDSVAGLERFYGGVERRGSSSLGLFDCTICTLFIASGQGSENKCIEVCSILLKLKETTCFFWPAAAFDEDIDRRAAFGHLVEELLQQEQPEVYNAFKMCGVSWWLLCSGWAYDCFWNRLSWPEIRRWLCLVALSPVDYQAFFFVCLAAAHKRPWLEAFSRGHFRDTVYQGDFSNFRLVDYADYLEDLSKKYQRSLSKRLAAEFDTN